MSGLDAIESRREELTRLAESDLPAAKLAEVLLDAADEGTGS